MNADGFIEPLIITFRQVSSTAVPNIAIDDETIVNNTGVDWTGFRFIVEGGLSNNGAVPHLDEAASVGFLTDPFNTAQYLNNDKELRASSNSGGTLSSNALSGNIWHPGLQAGDLTIAADPFSSGSVGQTFVFKEQPISGLSTGGTSFIPLPPAAWTSLSGLLGLGFISKAKNLKKILS